MPRVGPSQRHSAGFFPRVTLLILLGFALFLASAGLYALPVLLEAPPVGAIDDYREQRVIARLEGKTIYFLTGSFLVAALLGIRGGLPGSGRRHRS